LSDVEVGGIVGKLKLDDSDWNLKLAAAGAAADELGAHSPTIKVDVDSAKAQAALAAVQAAEGKLAIATDATRLAYLKLDAVQESSRSSGIQIAAGHLAAARAEATEAAAVSRLTAAKAALAAVNEAEEESEGKANDQHKTTISRMGAIVAAVAALVPLIAPLASYLVAAGGGFAGMAAVGILAILGIKNAMKSGTDTGNEYGSMLQVLKGDLNSLESTAAIGFLGGFRSAVVAIHAAMPDLNSDVSVFARITGGTLAIGVQGLINAFHILNPLFVQGAVYIENIAAGFLTWTENGGLAKFSQYAMQALPQVADLLGNLATSALDIIEALAPAGTAMVGFLNIVANVLSFLASGGPIFATLVAGVTAGTIAFKLFGVVTPIILGVRDAMLALAAGEAAAAGPIGLIVAGVTALVAVLAVSVASTQSAADAQATYTAAVQADNGAIGENVRLQVAKNLQAQGNLISSNVLGVSTKTLTDYVLGNADAHAKVTAAMKAVDEQYDKTHKSAVILGADNQRAASDAATNRAQAHAFVTDLDSQHKAMASQIDQYNALQEAIGGTTVETQAQLDAVKNLASQYGVSVGVYSQVVAGQQKTADSAAAATLQMQLENDAAGLLTNALTLLNGDTLDLESAQTGLRAANNSVTETLKKNKSAIDGHSAAAVSDQQAIQGQVRSAQQVAEAVGKSTGSTQKAIASYKASKDAIESQLRSQGLLTPALQKYIDKLYDIKNLKVPKTKIDIDDAAAKRKLAAIFKELSILSQLTVVVGRGAGNGTSNETDATGGTVGRKAGGGTINGSGGATQDNIPIWASAGEEVIRNGPAQQFRPLLKAINGGSPAQIRQVASTYFTTSSTNRSTSLTIKQYNPVSRDPYKDALAAGDTLRAVMMAGV
jgi:hypothetical protein